MKYQLKLATVAALAAICAGPTMAEEMIKLELELPKPLFAGTPKSIKTPNLERRAVIPEIMVPKGTTNVAAEKDVTSSDDFPVIGELEYVTDGDKDGADGSYVELGPGVQWVQIDLGAQKEIFAIALWHYHAQSRAYRDVIIQVADDADFIENVQTIFNNDHDNSAGLGVGKDREYIETNKGKLIDAKGVKGQFIRLYSNGSTSSDMNHYIEAEIFGK
ncbi:MAG: discoidin domain-containing protein [Pontiella sp.]